MKKVLSIVLALALVFGFAGMTFAMGPDGADPKNVGLVLTSFTVSDSMLSPLQMPNWSGTLTPTKTYAEGQPIWFIATYVQNKWDSDSDLNFSWNRPVPSTCRTIVSKQTVFTSKDNCVNYAYSSAYMNFAFVNGIQVIGSSIGLTGANGSVDAGATSLKVTMVPKGFYVPGNKINSGVVTYTSVQAADLIVADADPDIAQNYYLQIMGFTNACNEAQGTAIAKCPIDYNEFTGTLQDLNTVGAAMVAAGTIGSVQELFKNANTAIAGAGAGNWLNLYNGSDVKYTVVRLLVGNNADVLDALKSINAVSTDVLYAVFDADGAPVIAFVSSGSVYKGMVGYKLDNKVHYVGTVQYTADSGSNGKYAFTSSSVGMGGLDTAILGTKAIETADLMALMDYMGFSFSNNYPILAKHWESKAGLWQVLEAKYNVAAAVITNPDPGVDIVPKTGDASTAFGMIMVAIAGLAAVGFVMMKRVRG